MSEVFIRKLETLSALPDDDKQLIASLTSRHDVFPADTDIIREGDQPTDAKLIEKGMAIRYKLLSKGQRQIVGFLFPGDLCDLHATLLEAMDHSIAVLPETRVVRIPKRDVISLLERPAISKALLLMTLANESVIRDWVANIGARRAEQKIAHFFCEWHMRLELVGLAVGDSCEFTPTQLQIGDALGMTSVHVNRSLQSLRAGKLITLQNRRLTILDMERLRELGGFDGRYLHVRSSADPVN